MSKLKDELRLRLLGQLSSEKTELDVDTAFEVCRKVSVSFSLFCAENYTHDWDSNYWWDGFMELYTTEELFDKFLETYETEI
jgi:hypothetical protein